MGISKSYLKDKFLSRGGNTKNNFSVKKSTITGANKGLFSNNPIPQGGLIGLAHENNQPVGTLGKMHNHSKNPNMRSVKVGNQRYVYATKDIQPGEELTTNYRLQPELEQPEDFMGAKRFAQKGTYQMGGTKEDASYMNFVRTLPPNLAQPNDPSYNLRGYWNSLGNPESFDYNQPTDDQGYYHAFSRDPRTGQILKAPFHPTFKMAIEEDRKAGYFPIVTPDNKIKTVSSSEYNNKTPTYDFLNKPNYEGYFQMGGTIGIPRVNGQVVSSGPQPLTSVRKTRGPITKTKAGVKTMPTKAVKKILKNIK